MSKEAPFPDAGKLVTVIAVKEGDTLVTYGKVLVSRPNLVAVAAHVEPDALPGFHDSPLTLLYTVGELSFILRGRVRECIKPDRLIVVPTAEPRVGERREFIRADLTIACRVEPAQTDDEQLCREWVEGLSPDVTDYRFADTLVDLSGSGTIPPPDIVVSTDAMAFGTINVGDPPALQTFSISNIGDGDLDARLELTGSGMFDVSQSTVQLASGGATDIDVTFEPTGDGNYTATLKILSNDPDEPSLSLALSGSGFLEIPNITLSTAAIDFGRTPVGDPQTETLTISNEGGAELSGSLALFGDAAFELSQATFQIPAGEMVDVTVTFTAEAERDYTGLIEVTSNDPDEGRLTVSLAGLGWIPVPVIELSTTSMEFRNVVVGVPRTKILTITNAGEIDLTGDLALTGDGAFAISETDLMLAPGAALNVDVTFTPDAVRAFQATITITSNDPNDPEVAVDLDGNAANPADAPNPEVPMLQAYQRLPNQRWGGPPPAPWRARSRHASRCSVLASSQLASRGRGQGHPV